MTLPAAFAGLARTIGAAMGAPFKPATIITDRPLSFTAGGSISVPELPDERPCLCQIDSANDAMRREQGYQDTDVALLIIETTAVEIGEKVAVGDVTYRVESAGSDPAGIGLLCRGRPA